MRSAIRKHLRDSIAIVLLIVIGLVSAYVILREQQLRFPLIEEPPFELKAEFETAQAVEPGQGQTLRVAGVQIGTVEDVDLEGGLAIVTFDVDRDYLPIYRDATILLRPRTPLKDMFFEMDPGSKPAGAIEEGGTVRLANTAPDVDLDQVLVELDNDTRAYLKLLLIGGGQALRGRDEDLGRLLGSLAPLTRDVDRINAKVAQRRESLRRLITNFNRLTRAVGRSESTLTDLVTASNTTIGAIAEQDPSVQRAIRLLPGTLAESTTALDHISAFADQIGPALGDLRPFARHLDEVNAATKRLAVKTTPVIRDEIRPFVRTARRPVRDLDAAARNLVRATPELTVVGRKVNRLGNMAAHNPGGAEPPSTPNRDEGYLYWGAWLGHDSNSVFSVEDAHGVERRVYLTLGCEQAMSLLGASPLAPAVTGLSQLFAAGAPFAGGC